MNLYDASRRLAAGEKPSIGTVFSAAFKTNGSCPSFFLSVILVVLAIAWMMFSPLIYICLPDICDSSIGPLDLARL
jgi:hypothetical protein